MLKKYSAILLFAVLIIIDQLSKFAIRHFGGFYICNAGISWGIKLPSLFFWILWLAFTVSILYFSYRYHLLLSFSFLFLFAGVISNLFDRLSYGCITDFIDLHFWPAFNLADIFICLGAIILLAKFIKK